MLHRYRCGMPLRHGPAGLPIEHATSTTATIGGRRLIAFAGCNYLGLAQHPAVIRAMQDTAAEFGISTAAARHTTGSTVIHQELEAEIARLVRMEAAVLLPDGFTANLALAQALSTERGVAVIDARAHRSLFDAAAGAGLQTRVYGHLDAAEAGVLLANERREVALVMTDGVFAADGAVAPVDELVRVARAVDGMVVIDDCHGVGVLGEGGRGTLEHLGVSGDGVIMTGTLAKGLGCGGGFIAGPEWVCDLVRQRQTVYQTTTPIATPIAAAGIAAIRTLASEPSRLVRLRENTLRMRDGLRRAGIVLVETPAPIFAFMLRPPELMNAVSDALFEAGFLAPVLSYPQGPAERYFRLSVNCDHDRGQIDGLTGAFGGLL